MLVNFESGWCSGINREYFGNNEHIVQMNSENICMNGIIYSILLACRVNILLLKSRKSLTADNKIFCKITLKCVQ